MLAIFDMLYHLAFWMFCKTSNRHRKLWTLIHFNIESSITEWLRVTAEYSWHWATAIALSPILHSQTCVSLYFCGEPGVILYKRYVSCMVLNHSWCLLSNNMTTLLYYLHGSSLHFLLDYLHDLQQQDDNSPISWSYWIRKWTYQLPVGPWTHQ